MIYVKWFEILRMQPHGDVGGTAKNRFYVIAEMENQLFVVLLVLRKQFEVLLLVSARQVFCCIH